MDWSGHPHACWSCATARSCHEGSPDMPFVAGRVDDLSCRISVRLFDCYSGYTSMGSSSSRS